MTKLRKTYKHAASAREAVEHIFGYEPQHDSLSEILRMIVEQAEAKYENAKSSDLSATELKALKMHLDEALREEDLARDLVTELLTAADNLAAGQPHSTLVLSTNKNYGPGPYFTKASLYYWAKDRLGQEIVDWKLYTEEAPSRLIEGEILFQTMAALLDYLLTATHKEWRAKVNDRDNSDTKHYLLKGRINAKAIASKITSQLPPRMSGKSPEKTVSNHVKKITDSLLSPSLELDSFSVDATPMAYFSLHGLAKVVDQIATKVDEDPNGKHDSSAEPHDLAKIVASRSALKMEQAANCLKNAEAEAARQQTK